MSDPDDLTSTEASERDVDTDRDTDPHELEPVFRAIADVQAASEEQTRTIGKALTSLRTTVLEHYERTTKRVDEHAKRIRALEQHVGIEPVAPRADGL